MAEDISNKALVALLVAAIAVSLVGTMVSINRIGKLGIPILTARATEGVVKLNITEDITIDVTQPTINFGSGNPKAIYNNCTLSSNDTSVPACWDNSTAYSPSSFEIENEGSIPVDITIDSAKNTSDNFIGGTSARNSYKWATRNLETGAATTLYSWTEFSAAVPECVGVLKSGVDEDEVYVDIQVMIPDDAEGYKTDTITFTSSKA